MTTSTQTLASFLATSLWQWVDLRNGQFTPDEFLDLCLRNLEKTLSTEEGQQLLALTQPQNHVGQEHQEPMRYTGHVPCAKCGTVHWMHGPCPLGWDSPTSECLEGSGRTRDQIIADTKALNAMAPTPGDKFKLMLGHPPFDKLPVHNPPGVTNSNPWPVCRYCGGEMKHTLVESFCSKCGYESHADGDCGWPDEEGVLQHRNPNEAGT